MFDGDDVDSLFAGSIGAEAAAASAKTALPNGGSAAAATSAAPAAPASAPAPASAAPPPATEVELRLPPALQAERLASIAWGAADASDRRALEKILRSMVARRAYSARRRMPAYPGTISRVKEAQCWQRGRGRAKQATSLSGSEMARPRASHSARKCASLRRSRTRKQQRAKEQRAASARRTVSASGSSVSGSNSELPRK